DFDKMASDLQSELPSHLPSDYAANALWAAAAKDHNLVAAFEARKQDVKAAASQFAQLEALYNQLARDPNPDARKQEAIAWLQQQGQQLGIIMNSAEIIRRAKAAIIKTAKEHPAYDDEATQTRLAVAAAVRGASAPIMPDPPPNFGRMTDQEFRNWKRENLGWE